MTTEAAPDPADVDALREDMVRRRLAGARIGQRTGIGRADRDGPLPLAPAQRQLWLAATVAPDSPEFLVPLVVRLRGALDVDALGQAWKGVAVRHEILRTRYGLAGDEPAQIVDPPGAVDFVLVDFSGEAGELRYKRTLDDVRRLALTPIDLRTEHPMRIRLFRLAEDDHVLAAVFHHIACDAASYGILVTEVSAGYRAALSGQRANLPPVTVQYVDFACWQRERLTPEVRRRQLGYWRTQLADVAPLVLPADRARPAVRDWQGDAVGFVIPRDTAARLREFARVHDATLFMVLLTAFQVLLARYSGSAAEADITVGTAVSRRTRAELRTMLGYAFTTVALRARWAGDPAFGELVTANRATVLAAHDHADVPLAEVVGAVRPERAASATPLFQAMFDLRAVPEGTLELPGLRSERIEAVSSVAQFDLTLQLDELPDGTLRGGLGYLAALFDRATAERMAAHFSRLVESVAVAPETRVSAVDILPAVERRRLLTAATGAARHIDGTRVHEVFARVAARTPDAVALGFGDQRIGYAELDARANRFAHRLVALGVGPERTVGVLLDRGPDLVAALLGVWKAGGAQVPLEPGHPAERLCGMLEDAGASVVLTEARHTGRLTGFGGRVLVLEQEKETLAALPATAPPRTGGEDDLAYVIYTSGSTGAPNGVLVTHRGLANYLEWTVREYVSAGTGGAPMFSSVSFDLGIPDLYAPLMAGQRVELLPQDFAITDLGALLAASAPFAFVKLTPGHLALLTEQLSAPQAARLAGLVIAAGDAFTSTLADRWRALAGPGGTRLAAEYGPTEITVGNSGHPVAGPRDTELVSLGRPIPNTTMHVLDAGLGQVPVGVVGEIYVGGTGVARGYARRRALSAERFLPDPFGEPGSRLYRTGDLGRVLPDGTVDFVGRVDHQVKVRGYRVDTREVQAVVGAHPGVREVVVLALPRGGGRQLVAYWVAEGDPVTPAELAGHTGDQLPEHLVPTAFVELAALPLTANGKLDRDALPAPPRASLPAHQEFVAPRTADEARVAEVWAEALGVEAVGVWDEFFRLGGDSIKAVAVVGALRAVGYDVAVRDVFEARTLAGLCEVLSGRSRGDGSVVGVRPFELISDPDRALLPPEAVDAYPLSQVQLGMLVEMFAHERDNRYHNVTSFPIPDDRPFSPEAFRAAAHVVVERHDVLRTALDPDTYSVPMQVVLATAEMPFGLSEARGLTKPEQDRMLAEHAARTRAELFDIAKPPLLRMFVHVFDDDGWWLSITECHPIIEGWSFHTLFMELLGCYRRIRDGLEPEPLPPAAVRFADFIAGEQASLRSVEDREFWLDVVRRHERLELPAGWGDPDGPDERYRLHVPFHDLEPELRSFANSAGVPLKSVVHAAHLKVMSMLTPQASFFGGLVCDARPEELGAHRVYGMYLNTLPFAFSGRARTWRALVEEVFATEIGLWPHRRFPMPEIQRAARRGRLIDVMFNYLDFHQVDHGLVDFLGAVDESPNEFLLSVGTLARHVAIATSSRVFSRANGARFAALYRTVLEAMAADPDGDATADCLPEAERLLLPAARPVSPDEVPDGTLADLFAARVARTPGETALDTGDETLSYAELDARADRLALGLIARGAGPERAVAVALGRSADLVVAVVAVLKAGAAVLVVDPGYPAERITFLLRDADPVVLLTGRATGVRWSEMDTAGREPVCWEDLAATVGPAAGITDADRLAPLSSRHPAYIVYTSGSTGTPKGVVVEHRSAVNLFHHHRAATLAGEDGLRVAATAPFSFDAAWDGLLWMFAGHELHLMADEVRREPEALARFVAEHGVDLLNTTPSYCRVLIAAGLLDAGRHQPKIAALGGEELEEDLVDRLRELAPGITVHNFYGPSECTVDAVVCRVADDGRPALGRPVTNTGVQVLDRHLRPVPMGTVGEICLTGMGLARGYLGAPGRTAECFVPDPAGEPGSRLYRTGDLGRFRPDGVLEFAGRADDQVKIRGFRVEPGEVRAALLTEPEVRDAAVVAREDASGQRLVAYITTAKEDPSVTSRLRDRLAQRLPAHLVPAVIQWLPVIPLTAHGKLDRRALHDVRGSGTAADTYLEPQTPAEHLLAGIWSRMLGVPRVGARDRFFALGGDSLMVMSVVSAARRAGLALAPRAFYADDALAAVAAAGDVPAVTAEQGPLAGEVVPTPVQRSFLTRPSRHGHFTQDAHLLCQGDVDPTVLERALHAVIEHHDMLRLRAAGAAGRWRIWLAPEEDGPVSRRVDLTAVPEDQRLDLQDRIVAEEQRGLDLANGPIVRAVLFQTPDGPDELVVIVHHLAVDIASWQILLTDLDTAYRRTAGGEPVRLPAKTTSFPYWTRCLTEYARSREVAEEVGHWLARPSCRPLPVDSEAGYPDVGSTRALTVHAPAAVTKALTHRVPAETGYQLNEVLLAALAVVLAGWTGDDHAVIDVERHGRAELFPDVDLSRTVGWFTTESPVVLTLPENRDPAPVLAEVKRGLDAAPRHGIGYGLLRDLGSDRELAATLAALPRPQVAFNYAGRHGGRSYSDGPGSMFTRVPHRLGNPVDPAGSRAHLLDVDAGVYDNLLSITWGYSTRRHDEQTIQRLAADHLRQLSTFVRHIVPESIEEGREDE
ncbi:amino acid adenylation domain-containing protein [Amycolatopsis samaneae]|uniref:Amino acid adenylation domain-containing protein n=1 Tax=Amycolatopsis samaneae TaxID=664691 RepID=A0ABW5GP66_9PSEU